MTVYNGMCGETLQWVLIGDTTDSSFDLQIIGTGDMFDYVPGDEIYAPWEWCSQNIRTLALPRGLTSIGDHAFESCSIRTLEIPNGVTRIGAYAFSFNFGLQSLKLPASVDEIGNYAFFRCWELTSIKTDGVPSSIGSDSFSLGTGSDHTVCTVTSPNNIANGMMTGHADLNVTTFIYSPSGAAVYGYLSRNDTKLQVESAVRDGLGRRIDTHYPIKKEEEWTHRLYSDHLTLVHNLGEPPSSVMIFVVDPDAGSYTQIYGDVEATSRDISITFTTLPSYGSKLLIKALI